MPYKLTDEDHGPDPEPGPDAIEVALIPPAVRDGRRRPTPEELEKMPPNWEEIWLRHA